MDLRANVPLAPKTTLGVGGAAAHHAVAERSADVATAAAWALERGLPLVVLGGGSNVVVHDAGVRALVVEIGARGLELTRTDAGTELVVEAGHDWDELVRVAVARNLSGIECLSGIPGRVGAAPIQNIGAYGQEIGDVLRWVDVYDRQTGSVERVPRDGCGFGYRTSRFKDARGRYVVLTVCLGLTPGGVPRLAYPELERALEHAPRPLTPQTVRDTVLALRARKSMLLDPGSPNGRSCGSFFVNPIVPEPVCRALAEAWPELPRFPATAGYVKLSAAWLIQNAGFAKGHRSGSVGLSTEHTLCLVAHEGATSRDVVRFAHELRAGVLARFGVRLLPEPEFLGFPASEDRLPPLE